MTRIVLWGVVLWVLSDSVMLAAGEVKPPAEKAPPAQSAETPSPSADALRVRIETSVGDMVLELEPQKAPLTVANFLTYAEERFYDGTVFHRVIPHFLIQGGGYTPDMTLKTEGLHPPITNEWNNGLKNVHLTIGAARVPGKPDSATSQFYINVTDNPRLDQAQEDGAGYTVFGRVVSGEDVVEKIRSAELRVHMRYHDPSGQPVTPVQPLVIKSVRLLEPDGRPSESPPAEVRPAPTGQKPGAAKGTPPPRPNTPD